MPPEPTPTRRILTIGECMVELSPTEGSDIYRKSFAGDTFNTAWYLKQVSPDAEVAYLTAVGEDQVSTEFLGFMELHGIESAFVERRHDRTMGLYMIHLRDGERSFSYWRDTSAARLLADNIRKLDTATGWADVVYFSGITLGILTVTARDGFLEALKRARAGGRTIAFDPNLRPRLWRDPVEMRDWTMAAASVSDLVLPSFEDEQTYFADGDPRATVARYHRAGATSVVVKNGPDPVHYLDEGKEGTVTVPPARSIVDTTSAGDSFNAVYLALLDNDRDIGTRILAASDVARQCIGGRGALVSVRVPAELDNRP